MTARPSLVFLLLMNAAGLWALDPARSITQYVRTNWSVQDGLPQSAVVALEQTSDGYLWAGTVEGLVRFDGVKFTVFDKVNTPVMKSNYITALAEDRNEVLWIGSYSGDLYSCTRGVFDRHPLFHSAIKFIFEDSSGLLWAGSGEGLKCLQNGKVTRCPAEVHGEARAMLEDAGALWIATDRGLAHLAGGQLSMRTSRDGLPSDQVMSLEVDRRGVLWVGTFGGGIALLQNGRIDLLPEKKGLSNVIHCIFEDRDRNMWIGTEQGLARIHGDSMDLYGRSNGLSDNVVRSILEDREGNLWVGTYAGGLTRFRVGKFVPFGTPEGLSSDFVRTLAQDPQGSIWVGTESDGVNVLRNGTWSHYGVAEGLPANMVRPMYADRKGNVWIGTFGGGLSCLRNGGFKHITAAEGLASNFVYSIYEDRQGDVWAGTRFGLSLVRNDRVVNFPDQEVFANRRIDRIVERRAGGFWVSISGLFGSYENGKFTPYPYENGFQGTVMNWVYEDSENVLWLGTEGSGLIRCDGPNIAKITTKQGLFNDVVFTILEDRSGNFWMSCNRGIFRAARKDLTDLARGKKERVECVSYDSLDGLRNSEANGGANSGLVSADGRLWFATMGGAVAIDPNRDFGNAFPPPVRIEGAYADGKPATSGIPAGTEKFEFHYTALSLTVPEKTQFRYRLQGLDRDWVDAGTRRVAYYTHLPPGEYTFQVRASNSDGVASRADAELNFVLLPRFYQTAWFFPLCAAVLAAAVFAAYRRNIRRLREREQELVRLVQERTRNVVEEKERTEQALQKTEEARREAERLREIAEAARATAQEASKAKSQFLAGMSHELRTPLNAIIGYSDMLREQAEETNQYELVPDLSKIQTAGKHLLSLINNILDLSKIEAGKMDLFPEYFDLHAVVNDVKITIQPLVEKNRNTLIVTAASDLGRMYADATKVRQVLFNLLGNACKFTREGTITLDVRRESSGRNDSVYFSIRDTGIGITPEQLGKMFQAFQQAEASTQKKYGGTGLGLALSKYFCEMMEGDISVQSELGKGTSFTVRLPAESPSR